MEEKDDIVIVGSARTPIGAFLGNLSGMKAPELGAHAIRFAIERSGIAASDVNEVIMGCVLPAGIGQAPARQASIAAGIPVSVPCSTVNKVCGSGMKSVMLAHSLLLANHVKIMVAGGMESMSNSPYLLDKARTGYRMGHAQMKDHMFLDGLEDAYEKGKLMGVFAEATAEKYGFTREIQDKFALQSLSRAQEAIASNYFLTSVEIAPIQYQATKGETTTIQSDEPPSRANPDKIPHLRPAFKDNGTVTAANSSSIADGAAAIVLMRASEAKKRNLKPIAKILDYASHSQEPQWFTTAPVGAIQQLLKRLDWTVDTVDLYEINEAFAVVTLAAMKDLEIPSDKVNVHGGACALGHPIGASGARIICTLLGALQRLKKHRGIASLCIGGGEATAMAIEMIS